MSTPAAGESHGLKNNDRVLPRFCIDVNYKEGYLAQRMEMIDLQKSYTNSIDESFRFRNAGPDNTYNFHTRIYSEGGWSRGGDLQFGYFLGRNRRIGIGTGVSYFSRTDSVVIANFIVQYQSNDFTSERNIFRQHIATPRSFSEQWTTTNINIPLVLKFKHQFRKSAFGINADAGGILGIYNETKYRTNAAFNYQAIYSLAPGSDGGQFVYDDAPNPVGSDHWFITESKYTPAEMDALRTQGYNVGMEQSPGTPSGKTSYTELSYGYIGQFSFTYQLNYRITFNLGGYYMYQMFQNTGNENYRITDKVGSYNSLIDGVKRNDVQSYGGTVGFRFFIGKPRDVDGDGIPDSKDDCWDKFGPEKYGGCPDTDDDGIVDRDDDCDTEPGEDCTNGCPDRDNDCVVDTKDQCPDEAGSLAMNGCPDRDNDGVADKDDECPDVPGDKKYAGCKKEDIVKELAVEQSKTTDYVHPHVVLETDVMYFKFGEATMEDSSLEVLDNAVEQLNKNPEVIIFISGYTDDIGSYGTNMKLSFARAETVSNYLVNKGIGRERIILGGYGKSNPAAENTTPENRAKNRRIEMKLLLPIENK